MATAIKTLDHTMRPSRIIFRAGSRAALTRPPLHPRLIQHATTTSNPSSPSSRRRAVTVVNDTGAVPWKQLSMGEKAARTTQQTFNVGLVLLGIVATGAVATVLWLEVFSTDSKTAIFNRTADRIRKDPKCLEILAGTDVSSKREVKAYGEPSWSRWARNRTIASRLETDRMGVEHLHMHFYVEGAVAKGTVVVHMTRQKGEKEFEYRLLALDVPGRQRVYLENAEGLVGGKEGVGRGKMFGVSWHR